MSRIYISSTYEDLIEERRSAKDAILSLGYFPVGMEEYAASDKRPLEICLEDVRSSKGYVGIFAWRHGYRPNDSEKSITQLEYEEAVANEITPFIFLLHEDVRWPRSRIPDEDQPRIKAFRKVLAEKHTVKHFRDGSELARFITLSLAANGGGGMNTSAVPDLLPYLCDRSDQEYELSRALERSEKMTDRPVVCIVHGEETEAHDKFLERLQKVILPQLLPSNAAQFGVHLYRSEWPTSFRAVEEMHRKLEMNLSKEVLGSAVGTRENVSRRLGQHPGVVAVHSHLITETWQQQGTKSVEAFIRFWQDWPDLTVGQRLLVFLFVKYQGNKSFGSNKLRQYRRINREIRAALEDYDLSGYDRLTATLLPELKGPTLAETQNWAQSEEAGKFCDRHALVTATAEYYAKWARENPHVSPTRIPTDELVAKLWDLISRAKLSKGGLV